MAASIVRDGVVKTHLVFHLGPLVPLFMCPPESEEHRQAVYMLAHECAHIEDLKMKDEAFPGVLLQPREVGWLEQNLGPVGWALWEEYYACRRSAIFDPEQTSTFEDIVLSCMENAQGEVDEAVKRYRWHADLHQVWQETIEPATRVMKAAAYLKKTPKASDADLREGDEGHPGDVDAAVADEHADAGFKPADLLFRRIFLLGDQSAPGFGQAGGRGPGRAGGSLRKGRRGSDHACRDHGQHSQKLSSHVLVLTNCMS